VLLLGSGLFALIGAIGLLRFRTIPGGSAEDFIGLLSDFPWQQRLGLALLPPTRCDASGNALPAT